MKPIWSGTIAFGLVSIPVHLHAAVEASERVSFRQLHRKDRAPIRYKKFCSKEDVEVPNSEIVRGYQVSKGRYTVVEAEDLEEAREETGKGSRAIEVLAFVPLDALNPLSFDTPYFTTPDKGGEKAYALLRDALLDSRRVGMVRFFFRTRPVLAALVPGPKVVALETLRTFDELRDPGALTIPRATARPSEVKLATSLIEQMSEDSWDPTTAPDVYEKALRKLLAKRPTIEVSDDREREEPAGAKIVDLMDALRKSVERPRARAGRGRRRGSQRRGAA
jgi:DNA end-binding protein Ku